MKQEVRERLSRILEVKKESASSFSRLSGLSQTTLSAQLNGTSKVSCDTLLAFLQVYPDVSAEWLMRGTGDMYYSKECVGNVAHAEHAPANINGTQIINESASLIAEKDARIEELKRDNERLWSLLEVMSKR